MRSRVIRYLIFIPALLFLSLATWLAHWSSHPEDALNLPRIPWSTFHLKNGLQVIFHVDRSTPLAATYILYRAGSQHDPPQRTGLAHLSEHMMFQETEYVSWSSGGHGSTGVDYAKYSAMGEAGHLPFTLWAEAFRMGHLRHRLSEKSLQIERDIVLNERREKLDSRPYGMSWKLITEALYPPGHPYQQLTIGQEKDIRSASLRDVKHFLRHYYAPNNAILVVAGNFNPATTQAFITQYFSDIPASPKHAAAGHSASEYSASPQRIAAPVILRREKRLTVQDRVPWPRLYMVWPTGTNWAQDEAPLTMLSSILESGARSRLMKSLVRDKQLARSVSVHYEFNELGAEFQIMATAHRGTSLDALEQAIDSELRAIQAQPPTVAEIRRALNVNESSTVYGLQELHERAATIAVYTAFSGNPDAVRQEVIRLRLVQPADVQRVARQYLGPKRVVLRMLPGDRTSATESTQVVAAAQQQNDRTALSAAALSARVAYRPVNDSDDKPLPLKTTRPQHKQIDLNRRIPFPVTKRFRLSTGLPVVVVERPTLPTVHARLVIKAGSDLVLPGEPDLPRLTARMMTEGTRTRSALDISDAEQDISAKLTSGGNWESSGVSLQALSRNLKPALKLLADVIINPAFPAKEFEILRRQELQTFHRKVSDNQSLAYGTLMPLLYGKTHPYGASLTDNQNALKRLRREDLRRFYLARWRPNNATLFVAGDVESAELKPLLERYFASWRAAPVPHSPAPPLPMQPSTPGRRTPIYIIDRPGASQSYISMGAVGVERASLDATPLEIVNMVLGGGPGSRLAQHLRIKKGYTYYAGSNFHGGRGAGPFIASTHVRADATAAALENMLAQMKKIRDASNIQEYEIHRSKQDLAHNFVSSLETPYDFVNYLSNVVTYGLPEDYFDTYLLRLQAVTPAEIHNAAERYLNPQAMTVIIVGDRKRIGPELQALAKRDHIISVQPQVPQL